MITRSCLFADFLSDYRLLQPKERKDEPTILVERMQRRKCTEDCTENYYRPTKTLAAQRSPLKPISRMVDASGDSGAGVLVSRRKRRKIGESRRRGPSRAHRAH